jgi:hypothetical protein
MQRSPKRILLITNSGPIYMPIGSFAPATEQTLKPVVAQWTFDGERKARSYRGRVHHEEALA